MNDSVAIFICRPSEVRVSGSSRAATYGKSTTVRGGKARLLFMTTLFSLGRDDGLVQGTPPTTVRLGACPRNKLSGLSG